jgi:hypothetical protein
MRSSTYCPGSIFLIRAVGSTSVDMDNVTYGQAPAGTETVVTAKPIPRDSVGVAAKELGTCHAEFLRPLGPGFKGAAN